MTVSAEGRVEHQKLNRVAALLPSDLVFGDQLDYSCRLKGVSATAEKRVNGAVLGLLRQVEHFVTGKSS